MLENLLLQTCCQLVWIHKKVTSTKTKVKKTKKVVLTDLNHFVGTHFLPFATYTLGTTNIRLTSSTFLFSFALVSNRLMFIWSANFWASAVSTTLESGESSLLPTKYYNLFEICKKKRF